MNYRMQCSCGLALYRGADSLSEAIDKFKALMTQEAFDQHFSEMHKAGEAKPTLAQLHASIPQMVTTAADGLHIKYPALTKAA